MKAIHPPCPETNHAVTEEYYPTTTPRKNYVFAVNYEISMVDQFTNSHRKRRRRGSLSGIVEETLSNQGDNNLENKRDGSTVSISDTSEQDNISTSRKLTEEEDSQVDKTAALDPSKSDQNEKRPDSVRKSARERNKREVPLARARVRYDMQLVPSVRRNRSFLQYFFESHSLAPRRSSRLQISKQSESDGDTRVNDVASGPQSALKGPPHPFADGNTTVVWVPSKRTEWEDSVPEMTAVCTSAAVRRYLIDMASSNNDTCAKPFHPPLSRDYIRDRVDIDDPLRGFQLRHREGGWLQGFVLWTNFTTWTHYFKWDSLQPASGFTSGLYTLEKADITGELANELEAQARSGDPRGEGVVFEGIAELALLGGLGCGEILLRMALESIMKTGQYKYLVLQATESSKSFYERFGFVRVGAVCRYEKQLGVHEQEPIQGYRHWTHANESEKSLQKHGGPSYMMCLKFPDHTTDNTAPIFLDEMMKLEVKDKPTVEPLGPPMSSSASKSSVRKISSSDFFAITPKRGRPRLSGKATTCERKSVGLLPSQVIVRTNAQGQTKDSHKYRLANADTERPQHKRRRVSHCDSPIGSRKLVSSVGTVPCEGVWLAQSPSTRFEKGGVSPIRKLNGLNDGAKKSSEVYSPASATQVRNCRSDLPSPDPLKLGPSLPKAIVKTQLLKQKVKAYPRSRVHYYNRVVKPKHQSGDAVYFFVLQYDEPTELIKIVPIKSKSTLTGKREGRPRYQAEVGDTDENFAVVRAQDYDVVPASMVMKTPMVASEAWDVEDA